MVYRGSTIRIRNTITDFDGNPLDPDSHSVRIYDSNGNLKAEFTAPVKDNVGVYHVDYTVPSDAEAGSWKAVWEIDRGGQKAVEVLRFAVEQI